MKDPVLVKAMSEATFSCFKDDVSTEDKLASIIRVLNLLVHTEPVNAIQLTEEEKQWLHGVMQNPLKGEVGQDTEMRERIFHKTK